MQREGRLTALTFLVKGNTVSKPRLYEQVLVVPGFAARAPARPPQACANTLCMGHARDTCVAPMHFEAPWRGKPCVHAAMFVSSCAHRLRHVQQTDLCPPLQLGKEHKTLLARHGKGHRASLSEALLLSSVTATPTTCLAVPGGFIKLCLASVLQVPQSYKQRPAC